MSNLFIGITGKAGAGKDALAEVFTAWGVKRLALADALKAAVATVAGEAPEPYHTQDGKAEHSTVLGTSRRIALQVVGKALRESLGPDVWVRRLLAEWERLGRPDTVITDVRYNNEAEAIRKLGGTILLVTRPNNEALTGEAALHDSERGIDEALVDIEIINDGTLGELRHEGRKVLDYLNAERCHRGQGGDLSNLVWKAVR